jgi:mycoredoxin
MEQVTVYWRPGCPYCARLRQDLRVLGVRAREINIWADESAAATVRELAGGNETVPTVVIGDRGFVNPPASTVLAELRRVTPGFTPDQQLARTGRRLRLLRVVQWTLIGGLIVASFAVESAGHSGLSWALDGVAVAVYLAFRLATAAAR